MIAKDKGCIYGKIYLKAFICIHSYGTDKDIIMQKLPITLELTLSGLAISAVLGCVLGIVSALHRGQLADQVLTFAGIVGLSIPQFFFGNWIRFAVWRKPVFWQRKRKEAVPFPSLWVTSWQ